MNLDKVEFTEEPNELDQFDEPDQPKEQNQIDFNTIYFNPDESPVRCLILGASGSGKSHLLKYLLLSQSLDSNIFKFGRLFSRTHELSSDYDYIPDKAKSKEFNEGILKAYTNKLKTRIKNERMKDPSFKLPANFVIFDDMLGKLALYASEFMNFISTCRHTNTSVFLLVQQLGKGSSTVFRENITHAFLFRTPNHLSLNSIYENFGSLFKTKEEFVQHFNKATNEKHACMLFISHTDLLNEWDPNNKNNYYKFKAPPPSMLPVDLTILD